MKSNRRDLYEQLRKDYPFFVYEGFSYALDDSGLSISFDFNLSDKYHFRPEIRLPLPDKIRGDILSDSLIRNIIFNMGMIELLSYWKAACPPKLIIKTMSLTEKQSEWWKKLYLNGLGEFFHENGIQPGHDFIQIEADGGVYMQKQAFEGNDEVLVPIGGGKDSVVTLELLSDKRNCRPFIINPRKASMASAEIAGFKEEQIIRLSRSIDPNLLELNAAGLLNGHTPFSAMLAFTSVLVAATYGIGEIALSNESSANEPTIPGTSINHQYSKSLDFEEDFRDYISEYVTGGIDYYSYLRPLNEIQIAGIFSGFNAHFPSFKSCNVGSKTDSWCGACPKCLFTYIILAVFLTKDQLTDIFGEDLFEKEILLHPFEQLCGLANEKPFECVGTLDEVNAALREIIKNCNGELPFLLQHYAKHPEKEVNTVEGMASFLTAFEPNHIPSAEDIQLLKDKIHAL